MSEDTNKAAQTPPGVCIPWAEQAARMGEIKGDAAVVQSEWEQLDTLAYLYIWYWVHR